MTSPPVDILLAPIGKQPMPVLLPILEYAPAVTYVIPTAEVRAEAEAVRRVAKRAGHRVVVLEAVNPYRAEETAARCREVCARPELAGRRATLNISGGTAVMALGAERAAAELGLPLLYVDTDEGQIIHLSPQGDEVGRAALATRVTLEQYVSAHDATLAPAKTWGTPWSTDEAWGSGLGREPRLLEAARLLGRAGTASEALLLHVRSSFQQKADQRGLFALPPGAPATALLLLAGLVERGLIIPEGSLYRVLPDVTAEKFLEGAWLEIYVADACAASGRFDDVRSACLIIRDDGRRRVENELDVLVSSRGRVAAISCKTGGEIKASNADGKLAIYELDALLQADLMGLYARKVLITQQEKFNDALAARAYYGETCCIGGGRLADAAQIVYDHLERPQKGI